MKMFKSKKDENVEVKQDENTEEKKVRTKRLDFDKLIGDQNSERMDQLVTFLNLPPRIFDQLRKNFVDVDNNTKERVSIFLINHSKIFSPTTNFKEL